MSTNAESGIHHVTLITRNVQANVDFYVGFLRLRLIKQTGGYEDSLQLHLFYGDRLGSPGTVITFFAWEDGAPGRVGTGQVSEVAFAVPQTSMGEWMTRALTAGIPMEKPSREFGEPVLRLKDPDGYIVKLVGVDLPAPAPWGDVATAIRRVRAVTLLTDTGEETAAFVTRFGYRIAQSEGAVTRLVSDTDAIDVRDVAGYVPGIPGTGTADHIAFRAADVDAIRKAEAEFAKLNSSPTNVHDRYYFTSLYVREPGGTLIELATDGPGFAIDESEDHLGEELKIPAHDAERALDIKLMLPQFGMPGEPRPPRRELPFVHRFYVPEQPNDDTIIVLHGSGGNEADLMPLAHRMAPSASILGVRGRATEEGSARWFRRYSTTSFDQADIAAEAEAFAAFIEGAIAGYRLDPGRITVIGFSNGGNFAASVMALHPGLIKRAVLVRSMQVLDPIPTVDLTGTHVLMLNGEDDPLARKRPELEAWLAACGASLETVEVPGGHSLGEGDSVAAAKWYESLLKP